MPFKKPIKKKNVGSFTARCKEARQKIQEKENLKAYLTGKGKMTMKNNFLQYTS